MKKNLDTWLLAVLLSTSKLRRCLHNAATFSQAANSVSPFRSASNCSHGCKLGENGRVFWSCSANWNRENELCHHYGPQVESSRHWQAIDWKTRGPEKRSLTQAWCESLHVRHQSKACFMSATMHKISCRSHLSSLLFAWKTKRDIAENVQTLVRGKPWETWLDAHRL